MPSDRDKAAAVRDMPWSEIIPVVEKVARAFAGDGSWSVDVLETDRGWCVTDMAEAEGSFHWPECERLRSKEQES